MFETSSEHLGNILKEKVFQKVLDGKVVFVLKVYGLVITNVGFLANFNNQEAMFPEYSRNMWQMFVSKMFPRHLRNIVKLWSQKVQKIVLSVILWNCNIGSLLSCNVFTELYWNCFKFRVMLWKSSHRSLIAGKNFKIAQHYIIIINLFPRVFNVSVSSALRQIFVTARVFDIMQFDNMLQKGFNCSFRGSKSLPTRIMEPSTHWAFTCPKSAIETLEQGVKSV